MTPPSEQEEREEWLLLHNNNNNRDITVQCDNTKCGWRSTEEGQGRVWPGLNCFWTCHKAAQESQKEVQTGRKLLTDWSPLLPQQPIKQQILQHVMGSRWMKCSRDGAWSTSVLIITSPTAVKGQEHKKKKPAASGQALTSASSVNPTRTETKWDRWDQKVGDTSWQSRDHRWWQWCNGEEKKIQDNNSERSSSRRRERKRRGKKRKTFPVPDWRGNTQTQRLTERRRGRKGWREGSKDVDQRDEQRKEETRGGEKRREGGKSQRWGERAMEGKKERKQGGRKETGKATRTTEWSQVRKGGRKKLNTHTYTYNPPKYTHSLFSACQLS